MKSFLKLLILSFVIISACALMTEEEYSLMTNHNDYETLSYSEYVQIFKDAPDYWAENTLGSAESQLETVKMFHQQYQAQKTSSGVKEEFLKLETKRNLPADDAEFDWRKENPKCFNNYPIKNQGYCGSCFAFAATYVLAKRYCIFGENSIDLSPQDLLECTTGHSKCQGGNLPQTWQNLEYYGVSTEKCKPYYSGANPPSVKNCQNYCQDWRVSYTKYKAKGSSAVSKFEVAEIKEEIKNSGPVTSSMMTYSDLQTYRGGLYRHRSDGKKPFSHAISIIGWGYDSNQRTEYWIVANSWGSYWGEQGYFKIPFGECEIGEFSIASEADS